LINEENTWHELGSLKIKDDHDTQNYWVFGLCPSGILETRKHVLETGSVSILR
jgi:hypothetical protein